jgi:EAL domain-containing protein (putative c-di-GMP-specific phosphodiesterase class I)
MQYWADLANLALVVSSRTGKAVVYTPELTIQAKLRDILARLRPESEPPEGMYWVFQKVNRTNTGKVTGYETLVRWDVPGLGLVSPAEFIPLAEDLDVIHYLDRWTLMEVAKHRKQLVGSNGYQVSINVSAKTLEFDVDYLLLLESVIQNATPDVPWLIVELTETAIVENREKLASKLQRLQSMGVQIAIDDFGSGETNLAQVGQTPCDYLKIDGSLVRMKDRVQASSLLEISMTMAKLLGATALLEGIETQADFQLASTLGIPLVQGWYFGQPLTVEELYKQSN